MPQAGRSQDQLTIRWIFFFFNLPKPSSRTMALGSSQPLTEMSTRILLGLKGGWHIGLTLAAICEPIVYTKCGSLDVSQPYGPSWPVTVIALLLFLMTNINQLRTAKAF
jgi:hypothetical protein